MHTQRTIALIVATLFVFAVTGWVVVGVTAGWLVAAILVVIAAVGFALVRPWYHRWGATTVESSATMPGDELCAAGAHTTRAVDIDAPPAAVWPWLVQLGWGRAGWYSYDWIDNDGHPSADSIRPEWQHLDVGDIIAMTPTLGFTVRAIDAPDTLVAQAPDGTTWSLRLVETARRGTRLISRFRVPRPNRSLATIGWTLLADPGAFIMERRMLIGIRARAEALVASC